MVLGRLYYGLKRARENPSAYWAGQASALGLNPAAYTGTNRAPIEDRPVKRLKSTSSKTNQMAYSGRGRSKASLNIKNERGASTRAAAVKRGKRKSGVSKVSKGKRVKVSASFKAKVSKVIESKKIHGVFDVTAMGSLPRAISNEQKVAWAQTGWNFPGNWLFNSSYQSWAFAPEFFLSVASVLFNKKPFEFHTGGDSKALMRWFNGDQIGTGSAQGADNGEGTQPGQSQCSNNATFTVSNAWEKYFIRNNTQRTVTMKIYLCAPKRIGALFEDTLAASTFGNTATNADYCTDPVVSWEQGLFSDIRMGRNLSGVGINTMYTCPTEVSQFVRDYKDEVTNVVLEPGQTYDYFIQGPRNLEIDYAKMFKNDMHMYIQKCMRFPMFVYHSDIVGAASSTGLNNATVGIRAGMPDPSVTGSGLMVERRRFVRVACPDKAGARIDTALTTGSVQLGFHRPAYYKQFVPGQVSGTITRVDEENPVPAAGTPNVIG